MRVVTLFLFLTFLLAACTPPQPGQIPSAAPATPSSGENTPESSAEGDEATSSENNLAGTQWALESFGTPGSETTVVGESPISIEFGADGQVAGTGGCNTYSGSYQTQDNTLVLGEIVNTLIACVDSALMEQELEYFDALQSAGAFEVEGNRLTITYDEGQGVLTFAKVVADSTEEAPSPPTETPDPEAAAPEPAVS